MNILFLAHRLPYPPNKGDKIRSYNQLKFLSKYGSIYLGTLIDDPRDIQYKNAFNKICDDVHISSIIAKTRRPLSALGHFRKQPASVCYFYDKKLQQWVDNVLTKKRINVVFCFSSTMAEYLFRSPSWEKIQTSEIIILMDYCDVDSKKWFDYASIKRWPLSLFFQREGHLLLQYEQRIADTFDFCFFASSREKRLFEKYHNATNIDVLENGVDLDFFSIQTQPENRLQPSPPIIAFTGVMDYDVNIDGVLWFIEKIWPAIIRKNSEVQFYIVGSNPTPQIQALSKQNNIIVTGYIKDIREYYEMATICIAPLRIARGIQNKILEALAMSKAVVCTQNAFEGINAEPGRDLLVFDDPADFAQNIITLLKDPEKRAKLGQNGRRQMEKNYSWPAQLNVLQRYLPQKQTWISKTQHRP